MTDKEMIEEMAKRLASWCEYGDFGYTNVVGLGELEFAKELLKYYQPKIPEGSVVLSEKEKTDLYVEAWNKGFAHGRKETTREILSNAEKELHKVAMEHANSEHITYFGVCENIYHKIIRPLAKQLGVEVYGE